MGMKRVTGLSPKLGVVHPLNPRLKYRYPPPTVSVLSNIINALASMPKFYIQVLHLMNKMNLPAPFGHLTPAPPLEEDRNVVPPEPVQVPPADMEVSSSSEESELESDEEMRDRAKIEAKQPSHPLKRPAKRKAPGQRKRPRLQDMISATARPAGGAGGTSGLPVQRTDVFDTAQAGVGKKPEIRLAESITSALERQIQQGRDEPTDLLSSQITEKLTTPVKEEVSGFGTFQPARVPDALDPSIDKKGAEGEEDDEEEEEIPESSDFITREQLKKRLSKEEMKHISVFKNYSPGEPTTRLYLKNLAKQVEEKDLKFIYGRYVDWSSPIDHDMFSIQLMKQGRMKGQAFVALPSEFAAKKALKDTNGFILHDKPIVVSFARSAKPKEKEEPKAKKPREGRRI